MRRLALAALVLSACGGSPEMAPSPQVPVKAPPPAAVVPAPPAAGGAEPEGPIAAMLARVSAVRGLPIQREVPGRRVSRQEAIELIIAKTEKEVPKDVLRAQGEMLRGLGLIPLDYAFVDGIYALLRDNIAGFYDQHDDAMFLLNDLSHAGDEETLAHELVHALQDQNFDLEPMLAYSPGDADRTTAGHAVVEGDATAAMIEVQHGVGSDARISPNQLRLMMIAGVAMSEGGRTPRVLQLSLVAPYTDGFAFVETMKAEGGWPAIDAVYARLPRSTEQLLHVEKYLADEAPVVVPDPPTPKGFEKIDADVMGEQAWRIAFSTWTHNEAAADAAAGWGGDRFVVVRRKADDAWATAIDLRFDTVDDAKAAAEVLGKLVPAGTCQQRDALGPVAMRHVGDRIVLVAGPFSAGPASVRSAGDCKWALRWIGDTL